VEAGVAIQRGNAAHEVFLFSTGRGLDLFVVQC